jgi:hypothetical protein
MGGGWRSDTPPRHSWVNESHGNAALRAVAFTTDSDRPGTDG